MEEQTGLSDQYTRASPWPIPVVLGLVVAEIGILFGGAFIPLAVGGMLLLAGSVVGILRESGFADTLWKSALGTGFAFALGGIIVLTQIQAVTRGTAMLGTSGLVVLSSVALWLYESGKL